MDYYDQGGPTRRLFGLVVVVTVAAVVLTGCVPNEAPGPDQATDMVMAEIQPKARDLGYTVDPAGAWDWGQGGYAVLVHASDPAVVDGYEAFWVTPVEGQGLMVRGSVVVPAAAATAAPHLATCTALLVVAPAGSDCDDEN